MLYLQVIDALIFITGKLENLWSLKVTFKPKSLCFKHYLLFIYSRSGKLGNLLFYFKENRVKPYMSY